MLTAATGNETFRTAAAYVELKGYFALFSLPNGVLLRIPIATVGVAHNFFELDTEGLTGRLV